MLTNADPEAGNNRITVSGGIWDCNNLGQSPNPLLSGLLSGPEPQAPYDGYGFFFDNVQELCLNALTLKDPVTFGCTLDRVSHFTMETSCSITIWAIPTR